ncbi:hypothetical protein B9Z55_000736 [Caenorhabditis nigoni]|uniref:Uncharacterized protein n=1 Tax=Caenorhabditis nigoni TaxID=1611254 RepID=A0A2G5VUJ7_9PELO|nr:hypothetical protein B9Z55_000736 [Caenorhabditis nigoni]
MRKLGVFISVGLAPIGEYAGCASAHVFAYFEKLCNWVRCTLTIAVRYIDRYRQPPTHTLRQGFDWCDKNDTTFQIKSRAYIVRETDNRVASVEVSIISFIFGVWDKTEEEFLRMVD